MLGYAAVITNSINRVYSLQRDSPLHSHSLTAAGIYSMLNLIKQGYGNYDQLEKNVMEGFNDLIGLVDFIDDRVVRCWKNQCWLESGNKHHVSSATVCSLLRRYSSPIGYSRYPGAGASDAQYADILITRHWIRNILWNLGIRHGFMDEANACVDMRPSYALVIARETVDTCERFSMSSLEVHGVGLVRILGFFCILPFGNLTAHRTKLGHSLSNHHVLLCSQAEKLYDIAASAIHALDLEKGRNETLVPVSDASSAEPSFTGLSCVNVLAANAAESSDGSGSGLARHLDKPPPVCTPSRTPLSNDFINRFLAIFASFQGGNHVFLQRYVQKLYELSFFDE